MPAEKYELDWTRCYPENQHFTKIAILTGLPIEEIEAAAPNRRDGWYARDYIQTFRKLGFNTSNRFIKFDPDTIYPCIMRFTDVGDKSGHWYAEVYYDHWVECGNEEWDFDHWLYYMNGSVRITSMLQVWI